MITFMEEMPKIMLMNILQLDDQDRSQCLNNGKKLEIDFI